MAINEWKIWKKLGWVKEKELAEIKAEDDLQAVIEFLEEIDVLELIRKLETMKNIVHEEKVVHQDLQEDNLEKQIKQLDVVLSLYDAFQSDTDINSLRLKKIGQDLLKKVKEQNLPNLIKEKKNDFKWR